MFTILYRIGMGILGISALYMMTFLVRKIFKCFREKKKTDNKKQEIELMTNIAVLLPIIVFYLFTAIVMMYLALK